MRDGRKIIAVVPARAGDREVPYLNIKKLGPLPLIAHTLLQARESRYIDRLIVSTDDDQVAQVSEEYGAEAPFRRPVDLAGDIPHIQTVVAHAVEFIEAKDSVRFDAVVTLQATSPFRTARQIDEAIELLFRENDGVEGFDSVISLKEVRNLTWHMPKGKLEPLFEKEGRREDLKPLYLEDGAIRAFRREALDAPERLGERVGHVLMDKLSALTVHDIYDFWLAEKLVHLPRVLFRVDGGASMGMGHVYRSLAVAEALSSVSHADVCFLMGADLAEGVQHVSRAGHAVRVLPGDATSAGGELSAIIRAIQDYSPNIIVNDRPFLEKDYLKSLAELGASTINLVDSLDDIETPSELASVIISTMQQEQVDLDDYYGGPAFAILRDSFQERARSETAIPESGRRVVLSFGGSDPQGLTLKALSALDPLLETLPELEVTAVLGPAFAYGRELEELVETLGFEPRVLRNVEHMADIFFEADLVVCSGGMTVFEIAALGRPGIVICQNAREKKRMEEFSRYGTILHLGLGTEVELGALRDAAASLLVDGERRRLMSEAGARLVDARGAVRVAEVLMNTEARGPAAGSRKP